MLRNLLWIFVFCVTVAGCDIINPADPVPAFVQVEPFSVTTTPDQGSSSSKLTEGWFYVNNEFLGAYSLPATIPVIAEGVSEIVVFPGIRLNGIQSTPDIYPFFNRYDVQAELVPTETITINPTTTYDSDAKFSALETFEGSHVFLEDLDGNLSTSMTLTTDGALEGSSGRIVLTADNPETAVATALRYSDIPINGTPVFLEMDYKNDVEFALGLIGSDFTGAKASDFFFIFNRQTEWNKTYIELTERIKLSAFDQYQIAFRALHQPDVGETNVILLDNIKLVHF